MTNDYNQRSIDLHKELHGKIELGLKTPVENIDQLSVAYTPGVAAACNAIAADPELARTMTIRGNAVAIVSDGSAVLGLGNIGPLAAMPVMEGKAMLFKAFAGIDAWPICLATQNTREIIETVRNLAPSFGGINLEDISAPRCFEIEDALQDLGIPVFHDDQHGTAIVLLAALINAAKVVGKELTDLRVVISGAGAAGSAIARLLRCVNQDESVCIPVRDVVVCDSKGAIHGRREGLSKEKMALLAYTNFERRGGSLQEVLKDADVFVGVSTGGILSGDDVKTMADNPIILAMANPDPEIDPKEAWDAGAAVVGTGRSDYPNQVNNVLAFPGLFRGALDAKSKTITAKMKLAAAYALAEATGEPKPERVLPDPFDKSVVPKIADAVAKAAD